MPPSTRISNGCARSSAIQPAHSQAPDNLAKQISGPIPDLLAREALSAASIDEIKTAVRAKSLMLTDAQMDGFIQWLRGSQERSVLCARHRGSPERQQPGSRKISSIYENRKKERRKMQLKQAEAARNLAASAVTNSVAEGLKWYREATDLIPENMAG